MTNLILGSRTYLPLSDVDAESGPDHFCFGNSDVAVRAEQAGARRKPLETTRKTLLEMARAGGNAILFCARDAKTRQVTSGMGLLQTQLEAENIPFRVVSSPFSGAICEMVTLLRHSVDMTIKQIPGARKDLAMAKALGYSAIVVDKRDEMMAKLDAGKDFRVGDDELDARWNRWLAVYTVLCDALTDAERML